MESTDVVDDYDSQPHEQVTTRKVYGDDGSIVWQDSYKTTTSAVGGVDPAANALAAKDSAVEEDLLTSLYRGGQAVVDTVKTDASAAAGLADAVATRLTWLAVGLAALGGVALLWYFAPEVKAVLKGVRT